MAICRESLQSVRAGRLTEAQLYDFMREKKRARFSLRCLNLNLRENIMMVKRSVVLASLLVMGGFSPYALALPCAALTSAPNLADCSSVTAGSATVSIEKTFFDPFVPVDIVFTVVKPDFGIGGFAISETVHNLTGRTWDDFHFRLGLGTGASFVDFFLGQDPDVEFGTLRGIPATSDVFTIMSSSFHSPRALDFSGGLVPSGTDVTFSFSIVEGFIAASDGSTFTLRQLPSLAAVPEPGSFFLVGLGLGLAGLVALRRSAARPTT